MQINITLWLLFLLYILNGVHENVPISTVSISSGQPSVSLPFTLSISVPFYFQPAALAWPALFLRVCVCVSVGAMDLFSQHHLGWQEQLGLFCISMCVNKSRRRPDGCLLKCKSVCLASYMYLTVQFNRQRNMRSVCAEWGPVKRVEKGEGGRIESGESMRMEMMKVDCHVFEELHCVCVCVFKRTCPSLHPLKHHSVHWSTRPTTTLIIQCVCVCVCVCVVCVVLTRSNRISPV